MGKNRHAQKVVVRKREGNKTLGRPKRKWNDNIKRSVKKLGWKVVNRILAHDRLVAGSCAHGNEHLGSI
jgi:hypothetical protein